MFSAIWELRPAPLLLIFKTVKDFSTFHDVRDLPVANVDSVFGQEWTQRLDFERVAFYCFRMVFFSVCCDYGCPEGPFRLPFRLYFGSWLCCKRRHY